MVLHFLIGFCLQYDKNKDIFPQCWVNFGGGSEIL